MPPVTAGDLAEKGRHLHPICDGGRRTDVYLRIRHPNSQKKVQTKTAGKNPGADDQSDQQFSIILSQTNFLIIDY